MGDKRNAYRILAGKPEAKRSPRRTKCGWENDIKPHLKVEFDCENWNQLVPGKVQWRSLVNAHGTTNELPVP
jgi:hypothetical protein